MPLYPIYLLLGTVAGGIPIIIHMIHKRKAPKVPFPTLRFLKASNERTSRRQKIQDLLLLAMRVLLLFLLGLALAQPFLGSRRWGLGQRIHAVIILDNSYSMGTEHERAQRFTVAKDLAQGVVEAVRHAGNQAALMLAFPPHGYPKPMLTSDWEKLRRDIQRARLSQGRADLTAVVQRAYDLLAEEGNKAPAMEIYVITDMQRNAWSEPRPLAKKHKSPQPNLIVVDVGRTDYRNVAITDVAVHGGAHVRGRPVTIQAKIHNYSNTPAKVTAAFYVGETKEDMRQLEIPPDLTATASFNYTFPEPGVHTGWIQIDDDSLALDNRRDFCIEIQDHIPALVLRETTPGIPQLDPAFFVSKALDPFGNDPSKPRSLVQATVLDFQNLSHETLRGQRVVVLVDVAGFRKSQMAVLRQFVRKGGSLVIFCGPNIKPRSYELFLGGDDPKNAPMPVAVHEPARGLVSRKDYRTLVGLDYNHLALHVFKGYRLPQTVKVYNAVPIDVPETSPVRLLIGMSDGNPFLLENRYGKGRVVLFSTCTDPDWSNLAASRFFLPLLHRLVYYLTEREEVSTSYAVGTPVNITLRDITRPVTVEVRDPGGDLHEVKAAPGTVATQATFAQTDERGPYFYVVRDPERAPGTEASKLESAFVVNPDSQESDLTPLGDPARPSTRATALEKLLAGHIVHYVGPPEKANATSLLAAIEKIRKGVPLRNIILFIVLFIAIFETFFANRVVPALRTAEERRSTPAAPAPAPAEG